MRLSSLLIVEGDRPSFLAMARIDSPATIERDISSRSAKDSAARARVLGGGRGRVRRLRGVSSNRGIRRGKLLGLLVDLVVEVAVFIEVYSSFVKEKSGYDEL